jgi:hypothetical protein
MIPEQITRDHTLAALEKIEPEGVLAIVDQPSSKFLSTPRNTIPNM